MRKGLWLLIIISAMYGCSERVKIMEPFLQLNHGDKWSFITDRGDQASIEILGDTIDARGDTIFKVNFLGQYLYFWEKAEGIYWRLNSAFLLNDEEIIPSDRFYPFYVEVERNTTYEESYSAFGEKWYYKEKYSLSSYNQGHLFLRLDISKEFFTEADTFEKEMSYLIELAKDTGFISITYQSADTTIKFWLTEWKRR